MELRKSNWSADGNRVSLAVPFAKVDKENRLVSGFATLDNIDTSDDVVTAEASRAAFDAFRGNIREMHQPIAAGRLVDFREDEFYHDGEFYRGIFVTTYVSKGAPDTWEKVLDGTLSGFSIGGNITEQETKFVKDAGPDGKNIRFIKNYDLIELSLVDNPANQLANVFSIVKNSEGSFMKGMVAETTVVNVFWCDADEIAKNSTNASEDCLKCGSTMQQIGWFEKGEDDAAVKTAAAVADFLRQKEGNATVETTHGEGGVDMTDKIEKDADVVTSEDVNGDSEEDSTASGTTEHAEDASAVEVGATASEAKADEAASEEAPSDPDLEKMFSEFKDSVTSSFKESVEAVEKRVDERISALDEKASGLEKSLGELGQQLEAVKGIREDVEKRLDALEKVSAIKKSGEVETTEPVKKSQKGIWGGTFFESE